MRERCCRDAIIHEQSVIREVMRRSTKEKMVTRCEAKFKWGLVALSMNFMNVWPSVSQSICM